MWDRPSKSIAEGERTAISNSSRDFPPGARPCHGAEITSARTPQGAFSEDPDAGQGEVEFHRILGADGAESAGDFLGHPKGWRSAVGQSHPPAHPGHVGIQRDDQFPRGEDGPDPEVDSVFSTDHPAQEQVVTLAGGPLPRVGEEEIPLTEKAGAPLRAKSIEETGEPLARPGTGGLHPP